MQGLIQPRGNGVSDEPFKDLFGYTEEELRRIQTETTLKLINKYGKIVHCGDCFWFCECEPCTELGFEGICIATKFDINVNRNSPPCHRFELESEVTAEDKK